MGEINTAAADKGHPTRRKKLSTRVDLTPMVDLGFLLITFFIFTTSMSDPTAMKLMLPSDKNVDHPIETPESKTLTVIIDGNNTFSYYYGKDSAHTQVGGNTETGIRKILIEKKKELITKFGSADEFMVIIKPTDQANYAAIVNILDEMKINGIKKYVLIN
jgi:biopolymer transport protein ExbD